MECRSKLVTPRDVSSISHFRAAEGVISIPVGEGKIGDKFRMTLRPDYKGSEVITNKKTSRNQQSEAVTEYRSAPEIRKLTKLADYHHPALEVWDLDLPGISCFGIK